MIKNGFIFVLVACGAALAGCGGPKVAKGEGYSIPIPGGWKNSQGEITLPARSLAIRQKEKTHADYMIASVVITPVAPSNPPFDTTSASLCKQVGEGEAKQANVTLKGAVIVDGPTGKACQTDLLGDGGKHEGIGTFVKMPTNVWAVTCNRDPRDQEAAKACQEVLRGMKAE